MTTGPTEEQCGTPEGGPDGMPLALRFSEGLGPNAGCMQATPHKELMAQLLNPNVPKSEREHAAAREIERLRAALEVSQAATNAAVSKAQWQASTNAELNALHDQVRRLKADICGLMNDGLGA